MSDPRTPLKTGALNGSKQHQQTVMVPHAQFPMVTMAAPGGGTAIAVPRMMGPQIMLPGQAIYAKMPPHIEAQLASFSKFLSFFVCGQLCFQIIYCLFSDSNPTVDPRHLQSFMSPETIRYMTNFGPQQAFQPAAIGPHHQVAYIPSMPYVPVEWIYQNQIHGLHQLQSMPSAETLLRSLPTGPMVALQPSKSVGLHRYLSNQSLDPKSIDSGSILGATPNQGLPAAGPSRSIAHDDPFSMVVGQMFEQYRPKLQAQQQQPPAQNGVKRQDETKASLRAVDSGVPLNLSREAASSNVVQEDAKKLKRKKLSDFLPNGEPRPKRPYVRRKPYKRKGQPIVTESTDATIDDAKAILEQNKEADAGKAGDQSTSSTSVDTKNEAVQEEAANGHSDNEMSMSLGDSDSEFIDIEENSTVAFSEAGSSIVSSLEAASIQAKVNLDHLEPVVKGYAAFKTPKEGQQMVLWQFLFHLLLNPKYEPDIHWSKYDAWQFKIENVHQVSHEWGRHKNCPKMNYEKVCFFSQSFFFFNFLQFVNILRWLEV